MSEIIINATKCYKLMLFEERVRYGRIQNKI